MQTIHTVLCPIDFSPVTERQVRLSGEICRHFGARLVLHHNLVAAVPGVGVGWMWNGEHDRGMSEDDAARRLNELMEGLEGVDAEARVTRGLPTTSVLATAAAVGADLIVVTTHDQAPDEHTSVTDQLIEEAQCAVLALHKARAEGEAPHLGGDPRAQRILVATDLSSESLAAVEFGFALARQLPTELHLLHVARGGRVARPEAVSAEQRLSMLVPEELAGQVRLHVERGDPASQIARLATDLGVSWIVMGEHARHGVRHWFSRDTSRAVLHQAPCPVWYVPGMAA